MFALNARTSQLLACDQALADPCGSGDRCDRVGKEGWGTQSFAVSRPFVSQAHTLKILEIETLKVDRAESRYSKSRSP